MADKRLFEQAIESNPAYAGLQQRIAFGKAGQATKNMTLQNLIDWLKIQLSTIFMQGAYNLSDLANKATSRTNLEVYGKSETYTQTEINNLLNAVSTKLGGLTVLLSGGVNSTGTFQKFTGSLSLDDVIHTVGTGKYQVQHSYGSANYIVLATCVSGMGNQVKIGAITYNENNFILYTGDDADANDSAFRFIMLGF